INLALAHYRDTAETYFADAGPEVMRRLYEAPLLLNDIQSWILFGLGITLSIAAFIDALFLTDPYPGYGGVEYRLNRARDKYVETRANLIEELRNIRDHYTDKIEEIIHGLSARKREYDAILSHHERLISLFTEPQDQLERAANTLLAVYRDENCEARETPAPARFGKSYQLERVK